MLSLLAALHHRQVGIRIRWISERTLSKIFLISNPSYSCFEPVRVHGKTWLSGTALRAFVSCVGREQHFPEVVVCSYRILSFPRNLINARDTRKGLAAAFRMWSEVSPFSFKEVPRHVDSDLKIGELHGRLRCQEAVVCAVCLSAALSSPSCPSAPTTTHKSPPDYLRPRRMLVLSSYLLPLKPSCTFSLGFMACAH